MADRADGGVWGGGLCRFVQTATGPALRWEMRRNCALTPRQVMGSFGALALLNLGVATAFWLAGFPLVALFSGIELTAVAAALVCYARHACDRELLTLQPDRLVIEQHCGATVHRTEMQPAWVQVDAATRAGTALTLSESGRHVQLGCHVTLPVRKCIAQELRQALKALSPGLHDVDLSLTPMPSSPRPASAS
ncbi:MAG: DUF2244 domain-containing protein [Pseudomonadota bacterium]